MIICGHFLFLPDSRTFGFVSVVQHLSHLTQTMSEQGALGNMDKVLILARYRDALKFDMLEDDDDFRKAF